MSSPLINLSPDILRLRNEGYSVVIRGAYLIVEDVPYVTGERAISRGTIVSDLTLAGNTPAKPNSHVVYFIGSQPCDRNGSPLPQIQHQVGDKVLLEGLVSNRMFSNKPPGGYADYYEKMTRYADIISAPAHSLDETMTAKTFRVIESVEENSVFHYVDTNSARAEINLISAKLKGHVLAIIGLGGTGSYILDLIAKTPVKEIHLFDGDTFLQHNAFRAPGAAPLELLRQQPKKVAYLAQQYSHMHRHVIPHPDYVTTDNLAQLGGMGFVFVCMDGGPTKREIVSFLVEHSIPFIDVGMGVNMSANALSGIIRTTTCTPNKKDHIARRIGFGKTIGGDYDTNIQIAELNMLNACLAVIKWKKLCGFYVDDVRENDCTYTIAGNMLISEEVEAQIR